MKGCVFLTTSEAGHGFGLAGFRQIVASPETLAAEFAQIVNSGASGLVIVDERLLAGADSARLRVLEKQWSGILVVLPAPGIGPEEEAADYGSRLIARVLGYQMKL
jgi:vacuolar-type H+-ATPase subunit F/Vma7